MKRRFPTQHDGYMRLADLYLDIIRSSDRYNQRSEGKNAK